MPRSAKKPTNSQPSTERRSEPECSAGDKERVQNRSAQVSAGRNGR